MDLLTLKEMLQHLMPSGDIVDIPNWRQSIPTMKKIKLLLTDVVMQKVTKRDLQEHCK